MDYRSTLDYLFGQLPMYQRVGAAAFKKDLTNIRTLCKHLGEPHRQYPTIHIAGTNGKGSTAHIIAALLQAYGYTTGLYTSPHYRDFRERIKINGRFVPKKYVCEFVEAHRPVFEAVQPSFFEWSVALAFDYFAKQRVDVAVIEVGLGGRLDSTNIITPAVSVITNISYDHQSFLGDTLKKIAKEKAGIIKPGVPVLIGEKLDDTTPVFEAIAAARAAPLYYAEGQLIVEPKKSYGAKSVFDFFKIKNDHSHSFLKNALTDIAGAYQQKNLRTALAAFEIYRSSLKIPFSEAAHRKALQHLRTLTGFMGRWQKIHTRPDILCDSAHNEGGLKIAMEQLKKLSYEHLHIVLGAVKDKDLDTMLAYFPNEARYYFAKPDIPRGLDAKILLEKAIGSGKTGRTYSSVKNALRAAKRNAGKEDLIYVGGSTFVVAEVIRFKSAE